MRKPVRVRVLMKQADANFMHNVTNVLSNELLGGTVIYNEQEIFYNVGIRLKGSFVGRNVSRVGFNLRFDPAQLFRGIHDKVAIDRSQHSGVGQGEIIAKHIASHVRPEDQKVLAFPWDWDSSFSRSTTASLVGIDNFAKIVNLPNNLRAYYAHLYDMVSTTFNTAYMTRWTQHYGALAGQDFSSILNYIGQRSAYVLNHLPTTTSFAITNNNGVNFAVSTNQIVLGGTSPIQAQILRLFGTNGLTLQSSVTFGAQMENVSQGFFADGDTNRAYFMTSFTPRTPNILPSLQFGNVAVVDGFLHLEWAAIPNESYRLQFKTNLADTTWINLGSDVIANSGSIRFTNQIGADPQRFYRALHVE